MSTMSSEGSSVPLPSHSAPVETTQHLSSPVTMARYFARHEVQSFGYAEPLHKPQPFKSSDAFLKTLQVPEDDCNATPPDQSQSGFTFDGFLEAANALSRSMKEKHFAQHDLLVWKDTGSKTPRGHVTDTTCRPDITVAFEKHLDENGTALWPCFRLAGERASKGKPREVQEKQAISYSHFLLLARPDLYVAQGIFTSEENVMFLLGIGGVGIRSFTIEWTNSTLYKLMSAFIYRLYQSDHFADPSYKMESDLEQNFVTYTISIPTTDAESKRDCPGLQPVYASSPFQTRTHVLSNPNSQVRINGQVLAVVKDQFCRVKTRFDEQHILSRIHEPAKVPGVVEMVYHETINLPHLEGLDEQVGRAKHRLGMRQVGMPFASISTLEEVLKTAFDLLEVLRFLRTRRKVLHRDISRGNVMYVSPRTPAPTGNVEQLKFVKYILDTSQDSNQDSNETCLLLVDFNHAEDLSSNQSSEHNRVIRTGTPIFIARAVELGHAVPFTESFLPQTPISEIYASRHPDREKKFPIEGLRVLLEASVDSTRRTWRHELDHDAESVFWLVFYWATGAQPEGRAAELIGADYWTGLLGDADARDRLVNGLALRPSSGSTAVHSVYRPLLSLLQNLAEILRVDRHWLDYKDTRSDLEYVPEAFQRLILQFLVDHRGEDFMKLEVTRQRREVTEVPRLQSKPSTTSQQRNAENVRKRASAENREEQLSRKRNRLSSEAVPEDEEGGVSSEAAE